MPNKIAIVADSTAYLPEECLKQYNISVTPLTPAIGTHAGPGTVSLNYMSGVA